MKYLVQVADCTLLVMSISALIILLTGCGGNPGPTVSNPPPPPITSTPVTNPSPVMPLNETLISHGDNLLAIKAK